MGQEYLSNIDLYYVGEPFSGKTITVTGEEFIHITRVMRYEKGDNIHITDGKGKIFSVKISSIGKSSLSAEILNTYEYENSLDNFTIAIPALKKIDRQEFALEKCIEMGFTKFVFFQSLRSIPKSFKPERLQSISIAAMKQSLRAFLPEIRTEKKIEALAEMGKKVIYFGQDEKRTINQFIKNVYVNEQYLLVFGPEGGLNDDEIKILEAADSVRITKNRLRTETAIVSAAVLISNAIAE